MNKIGRVLAVFVATASLAFAGFAIATVFGGPDWDSRLQRDYLRAYTFSRGAAPDYIWTASRGSDGSQVASSKVLPDVLKKVLDDYYQSNSKLLVELNDREGVLKSRNEQLEAAKIADEQALVNYEAQIRDRLASSRVLQAQLSQKILDVTKQAQDVEDVLVARRADVLRLSQVVEQIRTDEFRLQEIRKDLESRLIQLQGDGERVNARAHSLQQQLN